MPLKICSRPHFLNLSLLSETTVNKIFHENRLLDAISSLIFPGDQERYNILLFAAVVIGAKRVKISFFY